MSFQASTASSDIGFRPLGDDVFVADFPAREGTIRIQVEARSIDVNANQVTVVHASGGYGKVFRFDEVDALAKELLEIKFIGDADESGGDRPPRCRVTTCLGLAYCASEASVRGHAKLQPVVEHALRSEVLASLTQDSASAPAAMSSLTPSASRGWGHTNNSTSLDREAFASGAFGIRFTMQLYRQFAERAVDGGISPHLPDHAVRWLCIGGVAFAHRSVAAEHGRPPSELVELYDLLAMRSDVRNLLDECDVWLRPSADRGDANDSNIRSTFWLLAACEAWCKEVIDRLAGLGMEPTIRIRNGKLFLAEGNSTPAPLVHLPHRGKLEEVWNSMRTLTTLRLRLWQRREARESLHVEMRLADIAHESHGCGEAVRFFCLWSPGQSPRTWKLGPERRDPKRRNLAKGLLQVLGPDSMYLPMRDGSEWDAFERACARWFDPAPIRRLERWKEEIRTDFEDSRRSRWPRSIGMIRSRIGQGLREYPYTMASVVLLLIAVSATCGVSLGHAGESQLWLSWLARGYVLTQILFLGGWVLHHESRRWLPRAFFGTGFVWMLSIWPLLEVVHKLQQLSGKVHVTTERELKFLYVGGEGTLEAASLTGIGLLFALFLVLLQVRGRKLTRLDSLLRTRRGQAGQHVRGRLASCLRDFQAASKAVAVATVGSMWWGMMVYSGIMAIDWWPQSTALATGILAMFPISSWAVVVAFISQLMWQDQFLTEPMSHDS